MNKLLSTIVIVGVFSTGSTALLQAQTMFLNEGFDYSPSVGLPGLNGGTGWADAWDHGTIVDPGTGAIVSDGGLSYTGYESLGNSAVLDSTGFRIGRNIVTESFTGSLGAYLDENNDIAQGGDLWISFLVQGPTSGSGFSALEFHRDNSDGDSNRMLRFTTEPDSNWRFRAEAISTGAAEQNYVLGPRTGGVDLIVLRLGLSSALGGDVIDVYLNPTTSALPDTATASATGLNLTLDRINFARFTGPAIGLDEIRMGDSFDAVVSIPEPSTFAILIAGCMGLVAIFRRRQK